MVAMTSLERDTIVVAEVYLAGLAWFVLRDLARLLFSTTLKYNTRQGKADIGLDKTCLE
jgi:prophage antirepressor-like protein